MNRIPYVILCSGQSNMARIAEDNWKPPENLQVWRYDAHRHGSNIGDGFAAPSPDIGNYANFYGAEIARNNPKREVYVLNISKGGTNLCQWFETADPVNMWTAIQDNVVAALNCIPEKETIDEIIWWGHESDAAVGADISATQFRDDFLGVITKIDEQNWVGSDKPPIRLHRVHPECNGLADQINFALELITQTDPERYKLSDTTHLVYTDNIHLDPDQKENAAHRVLNTPPFDPSKVRAPQPNLLHGIDTVDDISLQTELKSAEDKTHWIAGTSACFEVVDKIVKLKSNASLTHAIRSDLIAGHVVTISMENVDRDLSVTIDNQKATVTAGAGRRQASLRLRRTVEKLLEVSIKTADSSKDGSFSRVKLELGGAHTPYTDKQ